MYRCCLRKEQVRTVKRQITVNLVCRYLVITLDAVFAACIHKYRSSDYIRLKENLRVLNRAVNVRLGSEINDYIRRLFFEKFFNRCFVTDISLDEPEVRVVHN